MGLVRAILITCLCYFASERIWKNSFYPLPASKRCDYEKWVILSIIFLIESLW